MSDNYSNLKLRQLFLAFIFAGFIFPAMSTETKTWWTLEWPGKMSPDYPWPTLDAAKIERSRIARIAPEAELTILRHVETVTEEAL
jgi:hypothetical protein